MSPCSRLRQLRDHLVPNAAAPDLPAEARVLLAPAVLKRFLALPRADQRHLLATYRMLRDRGAAPETCLAGLLHDIGKSDGTRHAGVIARGSNVLLRRLRPAWHASLAHRSSVPRPMRPLHLAAAHARLGAEWLLKHGCDPRVCWLVRHHEATGKVHDPQLATLLAADDEADSSSSSYRDVGVPVSTPTGVSPW